MSLEFRLMTAFDVYQSYASVREVALAAEAAGFTGLARGDHLLSVDGNHDQSVTEAWTCIAGLARETTTLRFATLVSPATFRYPAVLARTVATVDEMSDGRAEVGMGAGWYVPEHDDLGIPLSSWPERFDVLEEQLAIVRGLFTQESFDFDGRYYHLHRAQLGRSFVQRPNPPIIVGGNGKPRTVRLAAQYADELNLDQVGDLVECARIYAELAADLAAVGRPVDAVVRSNILVLPVGQVAGMGEKLAAYEAAGVQRLYIRVNAATPIGELAEFGRRWIT
jgi:alkanesulfonate monooxygenase SsuD/methylene tetrahydromethanopterin reductase-like flavin-dependent oxidoreductase (luciferase family)